MNSLLPWLGRYRYAIGALLLLCMAFILLPVVEFRDPTNTVLEDERGRLLSTRISSDGQWRFPAADSIPGKVATCLLTMEDRHFYRHPGINPVSLGRALILNIRARKIVSGGSTISMQVVRLSRKGKPRTIGQKLIEMLLALRLELSRSKEEILNMYVSNAPFGGNVVGLDAAAWRYYGRQAHLLSWGEAASLAVLPNAPSLIHPGRNRDRLLQKRNRLLGQLLEGGMIDSTDCALAMEEMLPEAPLPLPNHCPHLLDRAESEGHAQKRLSTSIDLDLQKRAGEQLEAHYLQMRQNEVHNAAVLVLDIASSSVLAYVGNSRAEEEEGGRHVDIISAARSSGSILKPFLFTLMLDEGRILPTQLVKDIPTHISGYTPLNFDRSYSGAVPADQALVRSLNIPAVHMLRDYGLEKFHSALKKLNFNTIREEPDHYGLTLILGGAEVRLWDLCRNYAAIARSLAYIDERGYQYDMNDYRDPCYLVPEEVKGKAKSTSLQQSGPMSAAAIWCCFESLRALKRPDQEGDWESFSSSRTIAWKTGTSFGFRDAWAIGITPEYLVGVWVGNADGEGRPGLTGVHAAAPLMFDVFSLLPGTSWFNPPLDELVEIAICPQSGYRAGPDCPERDTILAPASGLRVGPCPYHQLVHLDEEGSNRVHSECYPVDRMQTRSCFILPPLMEWYYRRNNPAYQSLPPWAASCATGDRLSMELIYPGESRILFIPRNLDGSRGRLVFEAAHSQPAALIHWHLDEEYLGQTRRIHQMEILAGPGTHRLTLVDQDGNFLEKEFEIADGIRD